MNELNRLVLFLDGTWNRADGATITNIVRLRDLIDPKWTDPAGGTVEHQRIYYDEGVGTAGVRDRLLGGATGRGLSTNVRQAYRYLCNFWQPGTEVFVFGFSRGAFTARSLVGYVGAAGLLKPEHCSEEMENKTWAYYRTPPKNRYPSVKRELEKYTYTGVRIGCLGVFDTVGALGVPIFFLRGWNSRRFQFHDTKLSSIVDHAFHALALDEERGPFDASVWERADHKNNQSVEQVWFAGAHCDVGGGYDDNQSSSLVLRWMIDRIKAKHLNLRFYPEEAGIRGDLIGPIHPSLTWKYPVSRVRPLYRVVNQIRPSSSRLRLGGLPKHAISAGEMIHWSVLQRWKQDDSYRPANVAAVLPTMFYTDNPRRTRVVGSFGEPLDWLGNSEDRSELYRVLPPEFHPALDRAIDRQNGTT